jgi:hypothetical protein
LAQFYIWLNKNYPVSKEPYHEGVYSPTGIDEIYQLKGQIIRTLQNSASPESLAAIEEIIKAFPNADYSYTYQLSYENVQEAKFQPIDMKLIKKLYDARDSSVGFLIQSESDLLEAVIIVLYDYQKYLLDERRYNVRYLWNYCETRLKKKVKITEYYPKYEDDFSNHMAQFIKDKLEKEFQIVANREVGITPKDIPDFLIQLIKANEAPLELMVEVKCNWNKDVKTAMKKQLFEKYVVNSNSKIGLYVVAWFESDKWAKTDDNRAKQNIGFRKEGIEEAKKYFEDQAKGLRNSNDCDIRAIVIDCSLNEV